jgi:hypothetical protein
MDKDVTMDITSFKSSFSALLAKLPQYDPLTGEVYDPMRYCRAFAQAPMSLSEADFPTWIIFTGAATYPNPPDQSDDRFASETRDFECRLYVGLAQTGQDGERERWVQPYVDPARNLIQSHIQLYAPTISNPTPGIQRGYLTRDGGVATFKFNEPGPVLVLVLVVVLVPMPLSKPVR